MEDKILSFLQASKELNAATKEFKSINATMQEVPYSKRNAEKLSELSKRCNILKFEIEILKANRRQAYFAEYMPQIITIINKYTGKRYGTVTKQKINDECKKACNCSVLLYESKDDYIIGLCPLNDQDCSEVFRYNDLNAIGKFVNNSRVAVLVDNVIQPLTMEHLKLVDCKEFCNDAEKAAADALAAWEQIHAAADALNGLIDNYRNMFGTNKNRIEHIYLKNYLD